MAFRSSKTKRPPKVTYRISKSTGFLLTFFAGIGDFLQFLFTFLWFTIILGVLAYAISMLITLLIYSVFWGIFSAKGVSPFSGSRMAKKMTVFAFTSVSEFIPILGTFVPSLTVWTLSVIWQSQKEDRENAKEKALVDAKMEQEQQRLLQKRFAVRHYLTNRMINATAANDSEEIKRAA